MSDARESEPVGSWRHTGILCLILLAVAAAGFISTLRAAGSPGGGLSGLSGPALYLPLLAAEWGLFLYVRMGVRRHGGTVRGLIAERPLGARSLAVDLLLAILLLAAFLAAEYALDRMLGASNAAAVQPLLVRRAMDIPLWIALAASAGFVEEFTFRGYLQRQFSALIGNRWLGVAAQAILFGVTHGYQGGISMLKVTLFGLLFGAFALVRRSLVPGIAAHAAVDIFGGLAAFR